MNVWLYPPLSSVRSLSIALGLLLSLPLFAKRAVAEPLLDASLHGHTGYGDGGVLEDGAAPAPPDVPAEAALPSTVLPRLPASSAPDIPVIPPPASPVDVTVRALSASEELQRSARSVQVVELARAKRSTADLGQVLARQQGISIRREGALGAGVRLSLDGLSDEQVRVFIDGVPLDAAGYPFGLANVPLELLERVDVHRGVVPLRLGADALGGALELVSERARGTGATVSYQVGSFDTHRLVVTARHHHRPSGLFARAEATFDRAENDYPIRVTLNDALGDRRVWVRRNHDGYRAGFANVEAGIQRTRWAKLLSARGFFGALEKEIPSDPLMQVPYGELTSFRRASGALVRYESKRFADTTLSATLSYSVRKSVLEDLASCTYDWIGTCTRDISPARGERSIGASDQHVRSDTVLARLLLERPLGDDQRVRLASVPTFTRRTGEQRALGSGLSDPLQGRRDLITVVSGLEHELELLDGRLQNIAFVKHYAYLARSEELLLASNQFVEIDERRQRAGVGDGLRFSFSDELYAKVAYEWATRLPAPDQLFGDGGLVEANLRLAPEKAHNFNLETSFERRLPRAGALRLQLSGFARLIDDLMAKFVRVDSLQFDNVDSARSLGVQGSAAWTSPLRIVRLDANATYQDYRNTSQTGEYARFDGDRIPYRPYVFANGALTLFARGLLLDPDELSFTFRTSYVREFFVGWESANRGGERLSVPNQLVHSFGSTLLLHRGRSTVSSSLEVHNLTDARVYDFFGVQLPGRFFSAKLTIGI
jgi:vitamin B12 transporter